MAEYKFKHIEDDDNESKSHLSTIYTDIDIRMYIKSLINAKVTPMIINKIIIVSVLSTLSHTHTLICSHALTHCSTSAHKLIVQINQLFEFIYRTCTQSK